MKIQVAALYVDGLGIYGNVPGVDPWDETRDARKYNGPYPVVAHPPCGRWGKYWHGSPRKPHQYQLGSDEGCFAAALMAVRNFGGVLEHPRDSHAWAHFGLTPPPREGGWHKADEFGGYSCCVYQGHYGHFAGKPTWLYVCHVELIKLKWGKAHSGPTDEMIKRYGYEKARRVGRMALIGGKFKKEIRAATPKKFRDLLIRIASTAKLTPWELD